MIKKYLKKIFNIISPSKGCTKIYDEYREKDTMCDLCKCECKKDCCLIEITTFNDARRHFINGIGFLCPLRRKEKEND